MTNISEMKNAAIKIARHDGGCDTWKLGEDCANYKVNGNALILLGDNGEWRGWYNLNDVQMWHVTDDPVIETGIAGE